MGLSYYPYLISSLPMLAFGQQAPFSFDRFLDICRGLLEEQDLSALESVRKKIRPKLKSAGYNTERQWYEFDTALRNELVRLRAVRKKVQPDKYIREDGRADLNTLHIAIYAQRNPSPLEAERILDKARWDMLDELALGHYFDIDFLIIYAHKLLILQKWELIDKADKPALIEEALK
jgi:hypothetical protein